MAFLDPDIAPEQRVITRQVTRAYKLNRDSPNAVREQLLGVEPCVVIANVASPGGAQPLIRSLQAVYAPPIQGADP
jgi:hypothetical protein